MKKAPAYLHNVIELPPLKINRRFIFEDGGFFSLTLNFKVSLKNWDSYNITRMRHRILVLYSACLFSFSLVETLGVASNTCLLLS